MAMPGARRGAETREAGSGDDADGRVSRGAEPDVYSTIAERTNTCPQRLAQPEAEESTIC